MDRPHLGSRELAFILGVPAAWGILLLFHPIGDDQSMYPTIDGNVVAWQAVHIGMAIFVPLFAATVFLLLRGVESTAATVSRIGLAVFAILYTPFEILKGIGSGILTDEVNALPASEQAVGIDVLESYAESGIIDFFIYSGSIGLAVAMIGAAMALRGAYGMRLGPVILFLLATPLIAIHEPPFGPVGLAMFIVAVVLMVRQRAPAPAPSPAPAGQPGPA